ncbi:hypothetical protein H6G54_00765 [Anabaena cylindrica FACHB-243]|uniref:Uncharacterized protein n=1 Tax=Anabaena cylindrica (strain ATCC 27899 / PCC 7122) TaxID=272123 RepID=K9ZJH4_ANACC|nr:MULTISPECIES: hypothetical protein [Anabaena]AFZ59388.1 hypothetical protein Anacy_4018 [Anabaena cylindrica PCC 7122]MBD2416268.1 hypothetical protein [Anabaena cylindrica FACHB-243]MCM2405306.1 hypothetical protein [Anabaena sp. CCAP 1446/1C]BAY03571.1 hypothetical protein NIES19_28250 [Anabaena cylindrica PCC 7122]
MNTLFDLEQYTCIKSVYDPAWDDKEDDPEQPYKSVLEDAKTTLIELPEHKKQQWMETYAVTRCGKKHFYFRYCFYSNRKISHIHIPGGNIENAIALQRKEIIQRAIALGKSPYEIQNFIRGGFGQNGYRLLDSK